MNDDWVADLRGLSVCLVVRETYPTFHLSTFILGTQVLPMDVRVDAKSSLAD